MFEKFGTRLALGVKGLREKIRRPRLKTVRRFIRHQDGATAVEYGMVAAPFLALSFAIMETGGVFFAGQALETATADSARLILTGQAQTAGYSQSQFKTAVCGKVYALFDCAASMNVDVRNFSSFANISLPALLDANGNLISNFTYAPGGPGCITVVRLIYKWPVYVSFLGSSLTNMAGKYRLLVATSAFRNEPYQTNGGC